MQSVVRPAGRILKRRAVSMADQMVRRWGSPAPSFSYKLHETRRSKDRHPLRHADALGKRSVKGWADALGLRTPATLQTADSVEEIEWERLPRSFVVKPSSGAGSKGVFLLEQRGGTLYSLAHDAVVTPGEISNVITSAARRERYQSRDVLVEERIERTDEPGKAPFDWKVYAFYGQVGLIMQRDPAQGRAAQFKYYDAEGRDLGRIRYDRPLDPTLPAPRHPDELRRAAELLSAHIRYPFVRVDLYEDERGVVLGELTPYPGGQHRYRTDIDRLLGNLWEDAAVRLRIGE